MRLRYFFLGRVGGVSRALQKPLRLDHSHASMAAALALHVFAGAASEHLLEMVAEDPARTLARDCFATLAMTVSTLAMTILSRG